VNDLDARLTAALHADTPRARDVMFRVEVLVRLERGRFRRQVLMTIGVALVLTVLAAVNIQAFEAWIATDVWIAWMVALGAVAALFALSGVPVHALPGAGVFVRTIGRRLYP
jgi:hypothetical protein